MEIQLWNANSGYNCTVPWCRWTSFLGEAGIERRTLCSCSSGLWCMIGQRCGPVRYAIGPYRLSTLPSQSTVSRRLHSPSVQQLLLAVEASLGSDVHSWWIYRIDSKPLTVGGYSKDPDAKWGYATKSYARGYKLHAIWGSGPLPVRWCVLSLNESDSRAARRLIDGLSGAGYLVGDKQYDSNPLHAQAASQGCQVVAQQKRASKKLGHRSHHPARLRSLHLVQTQFGQALLKYRGGIERRFGTLTCTAAGLGPLPAWVRWPHRVTLWVQAKLIIHAVRSQKIPTQQELATA